MTTFSRELKLKCQMHNWCWTIRVYCNSHRPVAINTFHNNVECQVSYTSRFIHNFEHKTLNKLEILTTRKCHDIVCVCTKLSLALENTRAFSVRCQANFIIFHWKMQNPREYHRHNNIYKWEVMQRKASYFIENEIFRIIRRFAHNFWNTKNLALKFPNS